MAEPNIRQASREDIERFRSDRELGPSVTAFVAELDGELIAMWGLGYSGGKVIAFCDLKPEARKFKKTMHRAALRLMGRARMAEHRFIYASADPNEPTAERWLTRLGFVPVDGTGTFRWSANG